jgi:hypothetical protein
MENLHATDLRIGNLVYYPFSKRNVKINQANLSDFANGYIKFEPIPLTEEWLIKMGFEKSVDTTNLFVKIENINEVQYEITFNEKVGCSLYAEEFWLKDEIKYVHTLQNLYYALCGEELTIKNIN